MATRVAATIRRDRERPQLVDVSGEESGRFRGGNPVESRGDRSGGSRAIERELVESTKRLPPPPLPGSSEELANVVREQETERQRKHRERNDQAKREYHEYLISTGRDPRDFDDEPDSETISQGARTPKVPPRPSNRAAVARLEAEAQNGRSRDGRDAHDDGEGIPEERPASVERNRDLQPLVEPRTVRERPAVPAFAANAPTVGDVDRLWDWIRGDDHARFIGHAVRSSLELHTLMRTLASGEHAAQGPISLVRSLYLQQANDHPHIGFGVLVPVLLPEKMAGLHLYLRHDLRGQLPAIIPSLLELAQRVMPDVRLAIMDGNPQWSGLLLKFGFAPHTIFLQE